MNELKFEEVSQKLKSIIRSVPNFPKEGIVFRDITTLLKDKEAFNLPLTHFIKSIRT
jgi:adenine phosphoribosyltransferase